MALITLDEYKAFLGMDPSSAPEDGQIEALIPVADRSISKYTDRNFVLAPGTTSARDFQYDGSGFLEIDDCTEITSVSTNAGYPSQSYNLDTTEWAAEPSGGEVYYYLVLRSRYLPASPEMGFERNLDTLPPVPGPPPIVTVTARWGWDEIPADVKLAAAIIIQDFQSSTKDQGGDLTSEAIAGFSRSWQPRPNTLLAIPNRARDLLLNYQRVYS